MVWKGTFDAKHSLGRYYGRVTFVRAQDEVSARAAVIDAALAEFPAHEITVIDVGVSTEAAMASFAKKCADTAEWQRRNRERQVLLCPTCNGTGRA